MTGKMAARRRANRKWIALALVTVVLLSVMTWIGGNSLAEQNAQNLAQQQLLEEKIAEEEARSKELDEYSEYMKTDEFAEWYAKEKLGLIHKNEIIFKGELCAVSWKREAALFFITPSFRQTFQKN